MRREICGGDAKSLFDKIIYELAVTSQHLPIRRTTMRKPFKCVAGAKHGAVLCALALASACTGSIGPMKGTSGDAGTSPAGIGGSGSPGAGGSAGTGVTGVGG